jgi:predicted PurR-regulated permease PerM
MVGPLTGILETAGIVVIFTLFVLVKREDLRNRLLRLAGSGQLNVIAQAIDEASQRLGRYLLLQFLVNAAYGLLFGLGGLFHRYTSPCLSTVRAPVAVPVMYLAVAAEPGPESYRNRTLPFGIEYVCLSFPRSFCGS